jgi:hypothetical protein
MCSDSPFPNSFFVVVYRPLTRGLAPSIVAGGGCDPIGPGASVDRMRAKVGWVLSIVVLLATGALGLRNGARQLADATTPLQYSVTVSEIVYGVMGLAAGGLLAARHRSAVWLAAVWAVVVTYVASMAALAYAGAHATARGAVSAGIGSALIGAAVVWGARSAVRSRAHPRR